VVYRLFVNGVAVGIGPGRPETSLAGGSQDTVFDEIHIPKEALIASPDKRSLSIALHCFHPDGKDGAWVMLAATMVDSLNRKIAAFGTSEEWFSFNADSIWLQGEVDTGSAYRRVNEDIDGRRLSPISNWMLSDFNPRHTFNRAEVRTLATFPSAKKTAPLVLHTGLLPVRVVPITHDHYFFDFGRERMGGLSLVVPNHTVASWGGEGTVVEVRLSEQLSWFNKHAILYPGLNPGCLECLPIPNFKKFPKIVSRFTLAAGNNVFEHHEYVGLWRYGELRIHSWAPLLHQREPLSISAWAVAYRWRDEAAFSSTSPMLDRVWQLCRDTIKYTSLDTFTDSNVRERTPYEADGHHTVRSYWALSSDRAWPRSSIQFVLNNPTWPTEWKQYTALMVHEHYFQSGDLSLFTENMDLLVNNTMHPYIDRTSNLVNFTAWLVTPECKWYETSQMCKSPMCHADSLTFPHGISDGGKSCDNIDWLPKFREHFVFTPINTIINAFAVRGMELLSQLAFAIGRNGLGQKLSSQANRTRAAMLATMYTKGGMWCDGLCSSTSSTSYHAQHFPLWLGLTPDSGVITALAYLKRMGIAGSTYSSHSLIHGLYARAAGLDFGQTALELMTQCGSHSWCAMLQGDATTTWEHWHAHDGTHSHPWSTTPTSAIVSGLMGIVPLEPGWRKWKVKPAPGNLAFAGIVVPTPYGAIAANFTREQGRLLLDLTVPAQTEAVVCMPLFGATHAESRMTVDGKATIGRTDSEGAGVGAYLCTAKTVRTFEGQRERHARIAVVSADRTMANT